MLTLTLAVNKYDLSRSNLQDTELTNLNSVVIEDFL